MEHYAERDIESQGEHYVNHVMAMTSESLHGKSNIAAELAHRDIRIAELEARILDLDECNHSAMNMVRDQAVCICELYDDLKTAKRDGVIAAVNDLTACVVPIELKSCAVYKAIDLIDYANSLTGEE